MTLALFQQSDITKLSASASCLRLHGFAGWHQSQTQWFRTLSPIVRNYGAFAQRTQRATAPLRSMIDMVTYNALYSAQHFTRFQSLLLQLKRGSRQAITRLSIIDHGCGQGLATLALLDVLREQQLDVDIYLVEPSAHALHAAHCYVEAFAGRMRGKVRVHPICAYLGDEPEHILTTQTYTVHLFSNVLDIAGQRPLNLQGLFSKIARARGKHLLLAISPNYDSGHSGFSQIVRAFPSAVKRLDVREIQAKVADDYELVNHLGAWGGKKYVTGQVLALLQDNSHL